MSAVEEIKLLAAGLAIGETLAGQICPWCAGGRTGEKSLSITNKGGLLAWKCHRASCSKGGSEGWVGVLQPQDLPIPKPVTNLYDGSIEPLPEEYVQHYLNKYPCFTPDLFKTSCGWSPEYKRTVWTVRSPTGALRGYELRKHGNYGGRKTVHFRHTTEPWAGYTANLAPDDHNGVLVIVEDLISAKAAYTVGYESVSLMGTSLTIDKLLEILRFYPGRRLLLCLDKDATTKAITYSDRFAFLADLIVVPLDEDLKYLFKEEIISIVENNKNGREGKS